MGSSWTHSLNQLLFRSHPGVADWSLYTELGSKEGRAIAYANLGNIYRTRGQLDRAKKCYTKSLDLFRSMGATPHVEHVRGLMSRVADV